MKTEKFFPMAQLICAIILAVVVVLSIVAQLLRADNQTLETTGSVIMSAFAGLLLFASYYFIRTSIKELKQ